MTGSVLVEGVTKTFRRNAAVAGADFAAGRGVTGLLGPNGAGKTTLLRMLATVLAPDSGRLHLLGYDPATPSGRLAPRHIQPEVDHRLVPRNRVRVTGRGLSSTTVPPLIGLLSGRRAPRTRRARRVRRWPATSCSGRTR